MAKQKGVAMWRAFIGFGLILCCGGCLRSAIDVPPSPPKSEITRLAEQTICNFAAGLAESFATTADRLDAGELTTAAEANLQLQTANAAARKVAFVPLDEALNDALGGERWNAKRAGSMFREIAEGLRAASIANERESSDAITPSP